MEIGALDFHNTTIFYTIGMTLVGSGKFKGDIALIVFRKGIMEEKKYFDVS